MDLVNNLIKDGWLKTPRIISAFEKIKRADFLPEEMRNLAELDEALSIGYNQTISQPLVVAFMLELLRPNKGDKILDIGSGSGWTSALLSQIVGKGGRVISIDLVPDLVEFGKNNVAKYSFVEEGIAKFICADGSKGHEKEAPFDKILASATASARIPISWKEQLKIGGRIVAPVDSSICLLIKKSEIEFEEKEYPGFVFVPLIEKQ